MRGHDREDSREQHKKIDVIEEHRLIEQEHLRIILLDTKNGLFDPEVVRGLLQTVSLFPIGSYVRLNDGRTGKVIRASDQFYDRPIIEVVKSGDPSHQSGVVNLAAQDEVKITGALARPSY